MFGVNILSQVFGYTTAIINTVLYIPEVIHVYNTKDTSALNTYFLLLQMTSCVTTMSYGYLINEIPIVLSSVSILVSCFMLGYAKWVLYLSYDDMLYSHDFDNIDKDKRKSNVQTIVDSINSLSVSSSNDSFNTSASASDSKHKYTETTPLKLERRETIHKPSSCKKGCCGN